MEYRTYEICGELRHYSTGDLIHTRGQAWILDQDEYDKDVWWARNKDGEEIEFIPGTEDYHETFNESHIKQKLGVY
tara:strand:+ start:484 stop:711 length:228 start_codon:yes stop_codon:yes gene_type:complete